MIFVDRSQVENPLAAYTPLGQRAIREIKDISAAIANGAFRQKRLRVEAYKAPQVKEALSKLFHGKCAYCESSLAATSPLDIDQFRPKSSVIEAPDHPGYWWLANSWDNLLAACIDCNRKRRLTQGDGESAIGGKSDRFPLQDERMRVYHQHEDLNRESPLLLDPTKVYPEEHFVYSDGLISSESKIGNTTIAVLSLNRRGLVEERRRFLRQFEAMQATLFGIVDVGEKEIFNDPRSKDLVQSLIAMGQADAPYAGMMRQEIRHLFPDFSGLGWDSGGPISKERARRALKATKQFTAVMSDYKLDDHEGIEKFKLQSRAIERITIENIRAIKHLEVDFEVAGRGPSPWMMFLGENGTGKSSVLQAIALTLSDSKQVSSLLKSGRLDPKALVRHRCQSGRISVKLSGFAKPHELTVRRDRFEFRSPNGEVKILHSDLAEEGTGWSAQTVLLGYGATRLLPRPREETESGGEFSRIDNLFDPFVALMDAERWLSKLSPTSFDETAIVFKDLLALDGDSMLVKDGPKIAVRMGDAKISLRNLSDGYQTVVAVTADILEVLSRIWSNLSDAEGIVLIDELDAHLHPTWQMKIVGSLRKALPRIQFVATSHQPLCLRGLGRGEVVVMQRDAEGVLALLQDLPSPADFRVDQLLTSDFFGLRSTIDPETEELFDTYYALLVIDERTVEQETQLLELKAVLAQRRQLGDTQREGLYYEAIDKLLAEQATPARRRPEELRQEAVEQIGGLWARAIRNAGTRS